MRPWLLIVLCIFVVPPFFAIGYGLYYMWSRRSLTQGARLALSAAAALVVVGIFVSAAVAPEDTTDSTTSHGTSGGSQSTQSQVTKPSYTVASVEDDSFGATKRYVINVVLPGDSTSDQRMAIAQYEVEKLKGSQPFNAVGVFFWNRENDIGKGNATGSIDYAPGGDWASADSVETGDYDSMEYSVQF